MLYKRLVYFRIRRVCSVPGGLPLDPGMTIMFQVAMTRDGPLTRARPEEPSVGPKQSRTSGDKDLCRSLAVIMGGVWRQAETAQHREE